MHKYGTHNPPTVWWTFHGLESPAELVHDPERHGFCSGLKFVAPAQLLKYKRLRFAKRHEKKDRIDTALLEAAWPAAAAELAANPKGRQGEHK